MQNFFQKVRYFDPLDCYRGEVLQKATQTKEVYHMAVPKRKVSRARRDKRRSSHWKLAIPGVVACPKCGEPRLPHRACKACGYYNGREVISVEAK